MGKYYCEICGKVSKQKSHHEAHLESELHLTKVENFKLKMHQRSIYDIIKEYPEYISDIPDDINEEVAAKCKFDLIEKIVVQKTTQIMENTKETNECKKYKPSNKVIWELSENVEENKLYFEEFKKIQSVIDKVHQFMFNTNQINGITAMRDMMKVLPFILLKSYFNSDEFKDIASSVNLSNNKLPKYLSFASDITKILNEENPLNNWRLFIKQLISKVLPEVFTEGDGEFEFNKKGTGEKTFKYIVREFSNIDVSEQFIEAFSTACGDIHELFRQYAGGKEAKDFGGFNTPRHALNMIYQFTPIKELIEGKIKEEGCSIYDPTMGTGGFLTRFYKTFDISPDNIYGCELSPDTIKFAFVSLFMTTKKILKNCESCNSLTETNNLHKQETIGLANPPFGTSMKYKKWKKNGETFDGELETYEKKYPGNSVKFKDIYPIDTNNGACLFTQHFVYKIKENGLGIIILPDGELFDGNSKWSKTFRKWLLTNVNLKMIIKMPQGTFEHAGVKTNVLVFTKNGKTENIQYFDTTKECNVVKELFTITELDFKSTNYSLDTSDYLEEEETNFEVPMVKLSDICEISQGSSINKNNRVKGNIPYFGSNGIIDYIDKIQHEGEYIITGRAGTLGKYYYYNGPFSLCDNAFYIKLNDKIDAKYFYYYLNYIPKLDLNVGGTVPCINKSKLYTLKIPLLSLEIQEKIVEELSIIETNIKSIETRIEQLKEEKERFKKYSRKSEIKELLKDADIKKINEVMKVTGGRGENDRSKDKNDEYNIPYYDSNGITSYVKNTLYDGEYIITARKMSIGSVHFVKGKFYSSDNTINITSMNGDTTLNTYFYYWLKFNNNILINMSSGIKPGIRMGEVRLLKIPVPSPEIQEQCIQIYQEKEKFIQSIDDKIEAEKKYIEELKQLSKDIIYSYC